MTDETENLEIGRPTKKTEQRTEALLQSLRAGASRQRAAALAGIHRDTLYEWMKQDPAFSDAIEKAEGDAEVRNVAIIQRAADTTWQAAAWWLERKHKAEWSSRIEQTGADGAPVKVIVEYADKPTDA
jgi:hypothetical protein